MRKSRAAGKRLETLDEGIFRVRVTARASRTVLATALALAVTVTLGPVASASRQDPSPDPSTPTRTQVDRAKARVADRARDVASIRSSLVLANQRLQAAGVRAEVAAEKYNGAMWRLSQAKQAVRKADRRADRAKQAVADQRQGIAVMVTRNVRGGVQVDQLNALLNADGPSSLLDDYAAVHGAGTAMNATYDRYRAANALAEVTAAKAVTARAEATELAAGARTARDQATAAANAAQAEAGAVAAEKNRLLRELASAQHVSLALATRRQTALENAAQVRAAAAQQAQQQSQPKAQTKPRSKPQGKPQPRPQSTPTPQPDPTPPPPSDPPPAPSGSGGAATAIAYAKAQIGEPYQWGAAGPSSWDCSGLMMRAWGAAGVSLPHYSVGQYAATTHISASQLRPGDLVFWGSSSNPGSIHHVAMYIGGGMIVHAPRTGQDVKIASMYYWIPPNFFGRV